MNDWPMLKLGDVATVTAGTSAPQGINTLMVGSSILCELRMSAGMGLRHL